MVDRIDKIKPDVYRVEETQDPLEEQRKQQEHEQTEEEDGDNFDRLAHKTDWQILFDKTNLWKRNVEVKVEDIDRIQFLGLNFKTNPSLLKIRVFLYDGQVINTAFLSVSRSLALKLRERKKSATIDVNLLTSDPVLHLTIPTDEEQVDEEITRITGGPREKSFSKSFKRLISKKTWMQKLGIQDPVSHGINREILGIYVTVLVVISAISFGILFLIL